MTAPLITSHDTRATSHEPRATSYEAFLRAKIADTASSGFPCALDDVNPLLKPHQRACVAWAVNGGRRALFEAFGLGKSMQQLEAARLVLVKGSLRRGLIVCPLGVRQEFANDAAKLATGDDPDFTDAQRAELKEWQSASPDRLLPTPFFVRTTKEILDHEARCGTARFLYLTNFESVREGKIDPRLFDVVSLDEADCLRSFGSKTFGEFLFGALITIPYRFVATATPSPNQYLELIAYAHFLGIMDMGESKTRFFRRNSEKAHDLTILPHKEEEFWLWVASWAMFLQKPSDLGPEFSDEGYALPDMKVFWHEVPVDHSTAPPVNSPKRGQQRLFRESMNGVSDAAREKRDSLTARVAKMLEIVLQFGVQTYSTGAPNEHIIRAEQKVLSDTQGTGEGTQSEALSRGEASARSREAEGVHGGVPEDLCAQEAYTGADGGAPPTEAGAIRERCLAPGKSEAAGQGQESPRPVEKEGREVEVRLRPDHEGVRENAGNAGRRLCDLRHSENGSEGSEQTRESTVRGSLPPYGSPSRDSLSQLQRGIRPLPGQSRTVAQGDNIPGQFLVWCDLNDEQKAIERVLASQRISVASLTGSQPIEARESLMNAWRAREYTALVSKPVMLGSGVNLQQCNRAVFVGIGFKFRDFIQAIHRIQRFLQPHQVEIHIIYAESERSVKDTLLAKWDRHNELTARMSEIIRTHGLANTSLSGLTRSMGVARQETRGDLFWLINNDAIPELAAHPDNSVHLITTSVPFSTQYEYTPNFADLGHTDSEEHFFEQMDYLTPQLFRVLCPGRHAVIHCKDRVIPGGMSGLGFQTIGPFHCELLMHYLKHGFAYMGMVTILTDVVRENNQTYRLGWSEICKDGNKTGVGMPEYLLLFRKPPSDCSNSYADVPVTKARKKWFTAGERGDDGALVEADGWRNPDGYSRARWQIDADGFHRSSGNRLLMPEELTGLPWKQVYRLFRAFSATHVYDHEHHVAIAEALQAANALPRDFALVPARSWHPDIWSDITRMRSLNSAQSAKGKKLHLCLVRDSLVLTRDGYKPIQDVVPGDLVLTHRGRWRPVLAVQKTGIQPVVTLKSQGVPGLTLSPDHKLWVRAVRDIPWARNHSRLDASKADPGWVVARDAIHSYVNLKLPEPEPASITDHTHWWAVGRWLADGHIDKRGSAVMSCGLHKLDTLIALLGRFSGNAPYCPTPTCAQIALRDPGHILRETLEHCGSGAGGKHLPAVAFTLPIEQARALLDGYLSGDGHFVETRGRWTATSISRQLLMGLALLVQRVYGAIACVYAGRAPHTHVIEGRTIHARQEWILSFDLPSSRINARQFILDDGAWKRVRSIEPAGEQETWNLRVAEDESYTAEGCIVKNCPLPFDIVDRAIERYTMPGETVLDPFAGIGTVPLRAVRLGRRGIGIELNPGYYQDAAAYCQAAADQRATPSLFDLLEAEETEPDADLPDPSAVPAMSDLSELSEMSDPSDPPPSLPPVRKGRGRRPNLSLPQGERVPVERVVGEGETPNKNGRRPAAEQAVPA